VATIAAPHSLQNLGPSGFSWPFGQVATTQPSATAEVDVRAGVGRRRVEHGVAIFLLSPRAALLIVVSRAANRFVIGADGLRHHQPPEPRGPVMGCYCCPYSRTRGMFSLWHRMSVCPPIQRAAQRTAAARASTEQVGLVGGQKTVASQVQHFQPM
jgi:hypothetical protein